MTSPQHEDKGRVRPERVAADNRLVEYTIQYACPFPIAATYRKSTTIVEEQDPQTRLLALLDICETSNRFLSALLVAQSIALGIGQRDIREHLVGRSLTGGIWLSLSIALAKQVAPRRDALPTKRLLDAFLLPQNGIYAILSALVTERNECLHSGTLAITAEQAREFLREVQPLVSRLLQQLCVLKESPIGYCRDFPAKSRSWRYTLCPQVGAELDTSPRSIELAEPIHTNQLFAFSTDTGDVFYLEPFVTRRACPTCKLDHLYLLEKIDAKDKSGTTAVTSCTYIAPYWGPNHECRIADKNDDSVRELQTVLSSSGPSAAGASSRTICRKLLQPFVSTAWVRQSSGRLRHGDTLGSGGRYTILGFLKGGAMGDVYQAVDSEVNQTIAIKVLPSYLLRDARSVDRFIREAGLSMRLEHRHLVQTLDAEYEGEFKYLVMEYVSGGDLAYRIQRVREEGRHFTPKEIRQTLLEVLLAIQELHARHIVHRDIKPANILFDSAGHVKLADFGIAINYDTFTRYTQTGEKIGTTEYMSPEQVRGEPCVPQSDLFSLGIVAYEMLTLPASPSAINVKTSALDQHPEKGLVAVAKKLLRLDGSYQSASEAIADLHRLEQEGFSTSITRGAGLQIPLGPGCCSFVWIPPGDGWSSNLNRPLFIRRGFWMGQFPVTNDEYRVFIHESGYTGTTDGIRECNANYQRYQDVFSRPAHPVVGVSWKNAVRYCLWLSTRLKSSGLPLRVCLPTEAEWEYCCRAGSRTQYCFGDTVSQLGDYAWYADNSGHLTQDATALWRQKRNFKDYYRTLRTNNAATHPVGQKCPNQWGLYDMHGLVWEWCLDGYNPKRMQVLETRSNFDLSQELDKSGKRVNRGGAWNQRAARAACSHRNGRDWLECWDGLGFRVILKAAE